MDAAPEPFLLLEPEPAPRLEAVPALVADRGASSLAAFTNHGRRGDSRYRHSGALGPLAGEFAV